MRDKESEDDAFSPDYWFVPVLLQVCLSLQFYLVVLSRVLVEFGLDGAIVWQLKGWSWMVNGRASNYRRHRFLPDMKQVYCSSTHPFLQKWKQSDGSVKMLECSLAHALFYKSMTIWLRVSKFRIPHSNLTSLSRPRLGLYVGEGNIVSALQPFRCFAKCLIIVLLCMKNR